MRIPEPKKNLGQHWLDDANILRSIIDFAQIDNTATVLEIGPGPGQMTKLLAETAKSVIAVEIDGELAAALPGYRNVEVVTADIRTFDFSALPPNYCVVANIPYYLTSHIIQRLTEATNRPQSMTLLVQKEVAERIAAGAGKHSILSLSVALFGTAKLGPIVPASAFTPPPKVDSQVIRIDRYDESPVTNDATTLLRLIKLGFSSKRKKLSNNLSAGLKIDKSHIETLLEASGINRGVRAQELTLVQWDELATVIK